MIYLDNNATTMPLPEVVEAMSECLRDGYANPSSVHQFGQAARHRVERARAQVARLLGASPKEIVFTSGGTEATNLAIRGAIRAQKRRRKIVTTTAEHSATLRVVEALEAEGYPVVRVPVNSNGAVDEGAWRDAIDDETAIASLCHVNNETGVIADMPALAQVASDRGATVHVDAVQSAGRFPLDESSSPVHMLTVSAHKYHGPKGIGALFIRHKSNIAPLILGGTQERGLRGGTENVAGIVGMGVASEIALQEMERSAAHIRTLRDRFEEAIRSRLEDVRVIAEKGDRIHSTSNIAFAGVAAEPILILLSEAGVCASAGAACSSGSIEPSHVLTAMGLPDEQAQSALRFSFSRFNTVEEIDRAGRLLCEIVERLRETNRTT